MSLEDETVHRELDTEREDPSTEIAEIVAELEGKEHDELTSVWSCLDGVLTHVFSTPPDPDAEMEVAFDYEGYRITVEQSGVATFEKLE